MYYSFTASLLDVKPQPPLLVTMFPFTPHTRLLDEIPTSFLFGHLPNHPLPPVNNLNCANALVNLTRILARPDDEMKTHQSNSLSLFYLRALSSRRPLFWPYFHYLASHKRSLLHCLSLSVSSRLDSHDNIFLVCPCLYFLSWLPLGCSSPCKLLCCLP